MTDHTRGGAVMLLLQDADAQRHSHASYKRVMEACESLGLDHFETHHVLYHLGYTRKDGTLFDWAANPRPRVAARTTAES